MVIILIISSAIYLNDLLVNGKIITSVVLNLLLIALDDFLVLLCTTLGPDLDSRKIYLLKCMYYYKKKNK